MGSSLSSGQALPSVEEIEANAGLGVVTISMRAAWEVTADAGFITPDECKGMIALQLQTIRRELARSNCSSGAIETLRQMEQEYVGNAGRSLAIGMK